MFVTWPLTPSGAREEHASKEAAVAHAVHLATEYAVEVDVFACDYSYEATVSKDGRLTVRTPLKA